MPAHCECGAVLRDEYGLRRHKERTCKGGDYFPKCVDCGEAYRSLQGLNQHRRLAHPKSYNAEMEKEAQRARPKRLWSELEVRQLAQLEASFSGTRVQLNTYLAIQLNRTVDSIKGKRKLDAYKKLVEELRLSLERQSVEAADEPIHHDSDEDGFATPPSSPEGYHIPLRPSTGKVVPLEASSMADSDGASMSTSSSVNVSAIGIECLRDSGSSGNNLEGLRTSPAGNDGNYVQDPIREYLVQLTEAEAYGGYWPYIHKILDGCIPDAMSKLIGMLTSKSGEIARPAAKASSRSKQSSASVSARRREDEAASNTAKPAGAPTQKPKGKLYQARTAEYKRMQDLYKKDRRRIVASLFDESDLSSPNIYPASDVVETAYAKIFGQTSPPDREPVIRVDYGADTSYQPITQAEIERVIGSLTATAAGPDGVKLRDVKRMDAKALTVLFNSILYTSFIPAQLKECRTTLIPKGGDPANINNWRPITITSLILRMFNKIMARRLGNIAISCSQKGFRKIDGCLANTLILQEIIKNHRDRAAPYAILTLDLRKAFDSVSFESLPRALRRVGVHDKTIKLIEHQYQDCQTTIKCGRGLTGAIPMRRGVKQGDPLSPILFNLVMDELLASIEHEYGLEVGQEKVACMAYADDLLVVGPDDLHVQHTLDRVCLFLRKRGLEINPGKCTALITRRVPGKKKLYTVSEPRVHVNGSPLKAVTVDGQFKYLGQQFDFAGVKPVTTEKLERALDKLLTYPLKPSQRMQLLLQYIMPRALADLQYPGITSATLNHCDVTFRKCVKRTLHLPLQTPNAFFHAKRRDGGLGLISLATQIPLVLLGRINKLMHSKDALTQAALSTSQGQAIQRRLKKVAGRCTTLSEAASYQKLTLEKGYSGNGLYHAGNNAVCSRWILDPPSFWSGRDYVRAAQLRANMLPTRGAAYAPKESRQCRAGCARTESLSHVLQGCEVTHFSRIDRHNHVAKTVKRAGVAKGFQVEVEPRITCSDGKWKVPDLIFTKANEVVISDIAVSWEGSRPLSGEYNRKLKYYTDEKFIEGVRARYGADKSILVAPFIVGARGTWCPLNTTLVSVLGITQRQQETIILDTLKGGWTIHADFYRRTWRNTGNRR